MRVLKQRSHAVEHRERRRRARRRRALFAGRLATVAVAVARRRRRCAVRCRQSVFGRRSIAAAAIAVTVAEAVWIQGRWEEQRRQQLVPAALRRALLQQLDATHQVVRQLLGSFRPEELAQCRQRGRAAREDRRHGEAGDTAAADRARDARLGPERCGDRQGMHLWEQSGAEGGLREG
eukprot:54451-Chlamydomonas_euryale.AAC.1